MSSILKPFEEGRIQGKPRMKQLNPYLFPKSSYISRVVSNFYGIEIEIWAGFGMVGNTGKELGRLWATFEGGFFMFSWAKHLFYFLNIVASALKSSIKWSYFFNSSKITTNLIQANTYSNSQNWVYYIRVS